MRNFSIFFVPFFVFVILVGAGCSSDSDSDIGTELEVLDSSATVDRENTVGRRRDDRSDRAEINTQVDGAQESDVQEEQETEAPLSEPVDTGVTNIELPSGAGMIRALYRHPAQGETRAAIVYNHGVIVENSGYDGAKAQGYDVADFVDALSDAGYAALAPLRTSTNATSAVSAAVGFLLEQSDIDPGRIFLIGFSKGGVLSIQYAEQFPTRVKGLVVLAPALAGDDITNEILASIDEIHAPVYVGLGKNEPNPAIASNVPKFAQALADAGKTVRFKLDYDADHKWFYLVRDEFWNEVLSFLGSYD